MYRRIFAIAIPSILSNLSIPLLSLVDTALMGHEANIDPLGAIAVGAVIFNFIYYSISFLKASVTGLTAIDFTKRSTVLGVDHLIRGIVIALGFSAAVLLLQTPLFEFASYFVQTESSVLALTEQYYSIRIWAAPATISLMVIYGWSIGRQDAWLPLFVTMFINICNIVISYYLVTSKSMGIEGVAWGTLWAQYLGFAVTTIFLLSKKPIKAALRTATIFSIEAFKKIFVLNSNFFVRIIVLTLVFSFFTLMSAKQGKVTLASNEILMQMWLLIAYAIDGFANAAESLIGRYIGEKNATKLKIAIRKIFTASYLVAILYTIVFYFLHNHILNLLTDKTAAIAEANKYVDWVIYAPIIGVAAFIWDGIYIGATAAKEIRNAMLVATFFVFFPCYYLLFPEIGNHALWLAISLWVVCRGTMQFIYAKKAIYTFE